MKNPFSRKKSFTPISTGREIVMINQLINWMFPEAKANQKRSLLLAGKGTVDACVDTLSSDCASATLKLYTEKPTSAMRTRQIDRRQKAFLVSDRSGVKSRIKAIDNVQEVIEHPIMDLLWKPNTNQVGTAFHKLTWEHLLLTGDAYWYYSAGPAQKSIELHIMPPADTMIEEVKGNDVFRQLEGYKIGNTKYKPEEIIHFVYKYDPDTIWTYGKSPLQSVIDEYNISGWLKANLGDRAKTKFGTDAYLSLKDKGRYSREQIDTIKQAIENIRTGNINANQVLILEQEDEFKPFPLGDKDLPYDSNLRFFRELICNAYHVPVSKFTELSTRAGQETQDKQYWAGTITPLLVMRQEILTYFLLPKFANTQSMFFAYEDVVPNNVKLDAEVNATYIGCGVKTPNEVRYELNLEALPDGDQAYIPSNWVPMGVDIESEAKAVIDGVIKQLGGK